MSVHITDKIIKECIKREDEETLSSDDKKDPKDSYCVKTNSSDIKKSDSLFEEDRKYIEENS